MGEDLAHLRRLYDARDLSAAWAVYEAVRGECLDAEGHLLGALTARLRGDLPTARLALERALKLQPTGVTLGKCRMTYGVVLRELGDWALAIEHLEAFVHGIGEYQELGPVAFGAGLYNLALAYRQDAYRANGQVHRGRLFQALVTYLAACEEFRQEDMPTYRRKALQNLAWVACCLGLPDDARRALDEANGLCDSPEARWHQRIGEAFLAAVEGDTTRSMEICEALVRGGNDVPDDVRSHAYWLSGRIAMDLERWHEAECLARQAQEWGARARGENRCLQDAVRLLQEIRRRQSQMGA